VQTARRVGCNAIVHTSTASQNSLRRFNGAFQQLRFDGLYGSPFEWSTPTRDEKLSALRDAGIRVPRSHGTSMDSNLWGREMEAGALDDPEAFEWPEELFRWTRQPWNPGPEGLSVSFRAGVPVELDGEPLELTALVQHLNERVGAFGIGRFAGLEEIGNGSKVHEIREMPAATLLMDASRRLETATLDAEMVRQKLHVEQLWVREAVEGRWFAPLREATQRFLESAAESVSGTVRYQLGGGQMRVASIHAENARYIRNRNGYEAGDARGG
jgi:argininosuccinate synthase